MNSASTQHLYQEWLKGKSLRSLSPTAGISHTTLRKRFRSAYGEQATSIKQNSLSRSLLEDRPNDPVVLDFVISQLNNSRDSRYFRSEHSMQMLSEYHCATKDSFWDTVAAPDPQESSEPLRLPFFQTLVDAILAALQNSDTD